MAIYTSKFLPLKTIVANEDNEPSSLECKEWLLYLNNPDIEPEVHEVGVKNHDLPQPKKS